MAKATRMRSEDQVLTWKQVDELLMRAGELQRNLDEVNEQMTARIAAIKEEHKRLTAGVQEELDKVLKSLEVFAEKNQDGFRGKRSRKLNHGTIGWRRSAQLKLTKKPKEVIELLRKKGMDDCVKVSERVDKTKLREYPEETLEQVGATVVQLDVFFVESEKHEVVNP